VGAGAGVAYSMPLGWQLAQNIMEGGKLRFDYRDVIGGDRDLFEAIRSAYPDRINEIVKGAQRIARGIGTAESIDTFIDRFAGDTNIEDAGKLMIAHYILRAERQQKQVLRSTSS
jgi:hypothetical protein